MKKNCSLFFLLLISFISFSFKGLAEEKPFRILLGLEQNISTNKVELTPNLQFYYLHSKLWRLGFSAGLTNARLKDKSFKSIEISKTIQLRLRLFHPFYFLFGPQISYQQALEANGKFDIIPHPHYGAQAVLSWRAGFLFRPSQRGFLFEVSTRPWFSVTNMSLWGFSVSTSIGYRL